MALAGRKFRFILVGMVAALLVAGGFAVPVGAQEVPEPVVPGPDEECPGAEVVQTTTGTGNKETAPFDIAGDRLRLTVTNIPTSDDPSVSGVTVWVVDAESREDETSFSKDGAGTESSIVNAGPGTFFLETNTANANYAITVEDCNSNNGNGGNGNGGNATDQYADQDDDQQQQTIINIPPKPLPNTAGPALLMPAGGLLIGLGLTVLRVVRQRE